MKPDDWHLLYEGELSDAPGRCESFYEYVRYLGAEQWELACLGSSFSGMKPADIVSEKMSTEELVDWVFWQDQENKDVTEFGEPRKIKGDENDVAPGPRARELMSVAERVGCLECKRLIGMR